MGERELPLYNLLCRDSSSLVSGKGLFSFSSSRGFISNDSSVEVSLEIFIGTCVGTLELESYAATSADLSAKDSDKLADTSVDIIDVWILQLSNML